MPSLRKTPSLRKMPSLRKQSTPPEPEPVVIVKPGGKGRATPSRKDAEAARRTRPAGGGGDSKDAKRAARDERRRQATGYRQAMMSGDVSRLPPRERAQERVLAREVVDGRRNFGPIFLALLLLNFVASVVPAPGIRVLFTVLLLFGLIFFVLDGLLLTRTVGLSVRERYPQSAVPVKIYAVQRALLPGRFRMPRPRGPVAGWFPAELRARFRRR